MPSSSRGPPGRRLRRGHRGTLIIMVAAVLCSLCLVIHNGGLFLWSSSRSEAEEVARRAIRLDQPLDNYAEVVRRDGLRSQLDGEGSGEVLLDAALAVQLRSLRRQAWIAILNMDCQGDGWEKLAQWFAKRSRLLTEDEKIIRGQLRELKRDWGRYLSLCARSDDEHLALERIRLGAAIVAEEAARTGKDLDAEDILLEQQHSVPPRELGFGFKVPYFPVEVGGVVGMGGPGGLRGSVRVGLLPDYPFRQKLHDAFVV
ncbi:hypothetical protein FOZ63_026888 [Perkinsus olseni]|uniref:Uncharacterized protein n=1 Tax=Perkinsus olseni TaxID=32597 RepID=A0A7J6S1W0_PEROL|nr:hypothetical protein FOZ62_009904 [Perkinsus olseni]KAF4726020.1 hypothetical protein FOZ63_026888 [Perkinsus olseni]